MTKDKEQLITEFEQMKSLEGSARDFYMQIVFDPQVTSEEVKNVMSNIASDEGRHVEMVEEILRIIKNNL